MRQYIAQKQLDKNGLLTIIGKDYRYMRQVLRIVSGDMVQVRLPDGTLQNMTVCTVDEESKKIVLQICADKAVNVEGENMPDIKEGCDIWLFQFVPKSQKFDLIVRQATECGVSHIVPVAGEYCQSYALDKNYKSDRLDRVIKEARQQSGSATATEVTKVMSLQDAISLWNDFISDKKGQSFAGVLYERNDSTVLLHKAVGSIPEIKCAALFCGCEGGISPDEIKLLCENGVVPIHFETNILRCETAALYGIAALQSAVTEKKIWQFSE